MARWFGQLALLFVFFCVSVGCSESGPELGTVEGKVTLDGNPLPNVIVTFVPEAGGSAAVGVTDASGDYKLICLSRDGAMIGKHKVSVSTQQTAAGPDKEIRSDDPEYEKLLAGPGSAAAAKTPAEPIPARYNTKTELVHDVKSRGNTINLELKSK